VNIGQTKQRLDEEVILVDEQVNDAVAMQSFHIAAQ